jgi:cytochrome c oxidase cbb3-type subunit 3
MEMVAPDIREFTPTLVANVLHHGKKGAIGQMPAFHDLNDVQVQAVAAFIVSKNK